MRGRGAGGASTHRSNCGCAGQRRDRPAQGDPRSLRGATPAVQTKQPSAGVRACQKRAKGPRGHLSHVA
eukprot:1811610-Pyramimonas_sp.AAC.1